jgi:heme exporter protein B
VGNGVFFAALSIRSRNRELLLSLILFPIFIPALLAMVRPATTSPSSPATATPTALWIKLLPSCGYDIIFTTEKVSTAVLTTNSGFASLARRCIQR